MSPNFRAHLSPRLVSILVMVMFFVTGFAALLYQVTWQRLLFLFSGSDVRSVTIVLGAYLAGLGVGSLLAARFADRLAPRRALFLFALTNLGIAIFAAASRLLYYDLLFLQLGSLSRTPGLLLLMVFLSLLWPTTLMGMSLPLLARALVRQLEQAASQISVLNGINILGAGAGSMVGGWFLIGTLGYDVSIYIGAALSALVGVMALAIAPRLEDVSEGAPAKASDAPPASGRIPTEVWKWCALVFFSGFLAISLEIVWFRILGVALRSNAYTYSYLTFVFLIGDGAGSLLGTRLADRTRHPWRVFLLLQGGILLAAMLGTLAISRLVLMEPFATFVLESRTGNNVMAPQAGLALPILATYLIFPPIMLLVPSFLIGLAFPLVQKAIQTDLGAVGQRTSLVGAANIMGNTLASILTGLLLLDLLGSIGTLKALALAGIALLIVAVLRGSEPSQARLRIASGLLIALLGIGVLVFPAAETYWGQLNLARRGHGIIVAEDSTGLSLIHDFGDHAELFVNGRHQGQVPYQGVHLALGAIPALAHPNPQSTLLIGLGSGGTPFGAGINPSIRSIRVIEIVASEMPVLETYVTNPGGAELQPLLDDPRYDFVIGDGRRDLVVNPAKYDIVEADAIFPDSSGSGFLYSREFFEEARDRLADGGIMAQWRATPRLEITFRQVFPYGINLNDEILLGSLSPIAFDREAMLARLDSPDVQARLRAGGVDEAEIRGYIETPVMTVWGPDRIIYVDEMNSDLHPRDEYFLNNGRGLELARGPVGGVSFDPAACTFESAAWGVYYLPLARVCPAVQPTQPVTVACLAGDQWVADHIRSSEVSKDGTLVVFVAQNGTCRITAGE